MTKQIFNPLLESNFQKLSESPYDVIVYQKGNRTIAENSSGRVISSDTDAATVLNVAFAQAGKKVIKPGIYEIYSDLNANVSVSEIAGGDAYYLTEFRYMAANLKMTVGDGVTNIWRVYIHGITFTSSGAQTSGAGIVLNLAGHCILEKLWFENQYAGIDCNALTNSRIRDVFVSNITPHNTANLSHGMWLYGHCVDVILENIDIINSVAPGTFNNDPLVGLRIDYAEGVYAKRVSTYGGGTGLGVWPGYSNVADEIVKNCFFTDCVFDSGAGAGISLRLFNRAAVKIQSMFFEDCWASYNANNGATLFFSAPALAANIQDVVFNGFRSYLNVSNGVNVYSSGGFRMMNSTVSGNDRNATNTWVGVYLTAGTQNVYLSGNTIAPILGFANTQVYGIYVAGNITNAVFSNNIVAGNVTGGIGFTAGVYTNMVIRDNPGYNPQALAAIVVGASPFTYTNTWGYIEQIHIVLVSATGLVLTRAGVGTNIPFTAGHTITLSLYPGDALTITYPAGAPQMLRIPM